MAQSYKIEEVKLLTERFSGAKAIVLVDYKGINIEEVNELRNRCRKSQIEYFVTKNTFAQIALNDLGITKLDQYLVGPSAFAVCKTDEVAPAREIATFLKQEMADKGFPKFKVGLIGNEIFSAAQLEQLAKLPSKEELLAKVLASFNSPITGFVGVLQGVIRKFVYAVDAVAKKQAEQN